MLYEYEGKKFAFLKNASKNAIHNEIIKRIILKAEQKYRRNKLTAYDNLQVFLLCTKQGMCNRENSKRLSKRKKKENKNNVLQFDRILNQHQR